MVKKSNKSKRYTPEQRKEILDALHNGVNVGDVVKKYGVTYSTLSEWRKSEAKPVQPKKSVYEINTQNSEVKPKQRRKTITSKPLDEITLSVNKIDKEYYSEVVLEIGYLREMVRELSNENIDLKIEMKKLKYLVQRSQ